MVNAEGVEIQIHLREAPLPPREPVLLHPRPVVSGEAPVLAFGRERIWRRTGLHVEVIQLRLLPGVRAMPMHANRNVALENNPVGVRVGGGFLQLPVQKKLDEAVQLNRVAFRTRCGHQRGDVLVATRLMRRPLAEIRRAEFVAQAAERRVWHQPVTAGFEEFFILGAAKRLHLLAGENLPQEAPLHLHHRFVIHLGERVQAKAFSFEGFELGAVLFGNHAGEIQVKRMQRERGDRGVRIGIGPGVRRRGVVDWKNLDQFQSRLIAPIHEQFQIGEFSNAKTSTTPQTENRNRHARAAPRLGWQTHEAVAHNYLTLGHRTFGQSTVLAIFVAEESSALHIEHAVFIFLRRRIAGEIEIGGEKNLARFPVQPHRAFGIPLAQHRRIAQQTKGLAALQQRSLHTELMSDSCRRRNERLALVDFEQHFLKWLRKKYILDQARRIPGIHDDNGGLIAPVGMDDAARISVAFRRTIGLPQHVVIGDRLLQRRARDFEGDLPRFRIHVMQRDWSAAVCGRGGTSRSLLGNAPVLRLVFDTAALRSQSDVIAPNKQQLPRMRVVTKLEGDL